ncbi:uncharacterized protein KY384_008644 [Bacidia gigantensis]|uniref:uncharacterized protein n=1 Tax=Bacidia gigantensis TaxID=2732470 RepID=UPI001D040A9D|nr:uncharacterized protein KY384_008644 [Bacidia gigantensis]KAG8527214.1 hypothetical protein KY384_008644 [Bacidia gigantensis]
MEQASNKEIVISDTPSQCWIGESQFKGSDKNKWKASMKNYKSSLEKVKSGKMKKQVSEKSIYENFEQQYPGRNLQEDIQLFDRNGVPEEFKDCGKRDAGEASKSSEDNAQKQKRQARRLKAHPAQITSAMPPTLISCTEQRCQITHCAALVIRNRAIIKQYYDPTFVYLEAKNVEYQKEIKALEKKEEWKAAHKMREEWYESLSEEGRVRDEKNRCDALAEADFVKHWPALPTIRMSKPQPQYIYCCHSTRNPDSCHLHLLMNLASNTSYYRDLKKQLGLKIRHLREERELLIRFNSHNHHDQRIRQLNRQMKFVRVNQLAKVDPLKEKQDRYVIGIFEKHWPGVDWQTYESQAYSQLEDEDDVDGSSMTLQHGDRGNIDEIQENEQSGEWEGVQESEQHGAIEDVDEAQESEEYEDEEDVDETPETLQHGDGGVMDEVQENEQSGEWEGVQETEQHGAGEDEDEAQAADQDDISEVLDFGEGEDLEPGMSVFRELFSPVR